MRRALASTASTCARVDGVLACRRPLALLFSPSPLDGVQRAVYGERAAELRTKAAHGSKETMLRAQNCSQVVATALRRTKSRGEEFDSLSACTFSWCPQSARYTVSGGEFATLDAMGASPCDSVSDLAARKTLGIPAKPRV